LHRFAQRFSAFLFPYPPSSIPFLLYQLPNLSFSCPCSLFLPPLHDQITRRHPY
jgi:hypothetical protein